MIVCHIKNAFLAAESAFLAVESAFLAVESATLAVESAILAVESVFVESVFASVLEELLQAAKAPIAKTKKNFFML